MLFISTNHWCFICRVRWLINWYTQKITFIPVCNKTNVFGDKRLLQCYYVNFIIFWEWFRKLIYCALAFTPLRKATNYLLCIYLTCLRVRVLYFPPWLRILYHFLYSTNIPVYINSQRRYFPRETIVSMILLETKQATKTPLREHMEPQMNRQAAQKCLLSKSNIFFIGSSWNLVTILKGLISRLR